MSETYRLYSPIIELEFDGRPRYWRILLALWVIGSLALGILLIYLYAVPFANWVGFETALLVGIALLILELEGVSDT